MITEQQGTERRFERDHIPPTFSCSVLVSCSLIKNMRKTIFAVYMLRHGKKKKKCIISVMDIGAQSKALVNRHMENADAGFCQIAQQCCEDCQMVSGTVALN